MLNTILFPRTSGVTQYPTHLNQKNVTADGSSVTVAGVTCEDGQSGVTTATVTHKRHYSYKFKTICWVCGNEFDSARSDARTCGDVCRARLKRNREKVRKFQQEILFRIGDIQAMAESHDPVLANKAKDALCELRDQIVQACEESHA